MPLGVKRDNRFFTDRFATLLTFVSIVGVKALLAKYFVVALHKWTVRQARLAYAA